MLLNLQMLISISAQPTGENYSNRKTALQFSIPLKSEPLNAQILIPLPKQLGQVRLDKSTLIQ